MSSVSDIKDALKTILETVTGIDRHYNLTAF